MTPTLPQPSGATPAQGRAWPRPAAGACPALALEQFGRSRQGANGVATRSHCEAIGALERGDHSSTFDCPVDPLPEPCPNPGGGPRKT